MGHFFIFLLQRLTKEVSLTLTGLRESVVAISERVNRKTQIVRRHWHAAALMDQIEHVHRSLGRSLCDVMAPSGTFTGTLSRSALHVDEHAALLDAATAVRQLKQELMRVEASIRDLEVEALHEECLKIQRDLSSRSAALSRLIVAPTSSAIGFSVAQLNLPVMLRVGALLRGPMLLPPPWDVPLRAGDIVIMLGPQEDLQRAAPLFVGQQGLGGLKKGPVR